jgi:uncharacterized LabA/DUF88 family protein
MSQPLSTVVFVDAQNFRRNLQQFQFQTDPTRRAFRLDEKHFQWANFFSEATDQFSALTGHTHRLVRVYWYNAATMTPFKARRSAVMRALNQCREVLPNITYQQVVDLAQGWHHRERQHFDVDRRNTYEDIQRHTDFLEFKFVGQYRVNPFEVYKFEEMHDGGLLYLGTRVGEKGVDIGIATDMIAKMPHYDAAVLVSGDADFLPAVCYVKDNLRAVYQFSIAKGVPPRIRYLSPWLKGITDAFGFFDERDLLGRFFDPEAVPPAIAEAVSDHLTNLE